MYYHVTPRKNRESIEKTGIDPVFSRGKQQLSWFVAKEKLAWAILHTMRRHEVGIDEIDIFAVILLKKARKTAYRGIFSTPCAHRDARLVGTANGLLDRIEKDRL